MYYRSSQQRKDGSYSYQAECIDCFKQRVTKNQRMRQRGLTESQLKKVLEPAACECCGSTNRVAVDHDHKTGKVRGLLCVSCNTALGKLDDDVPRMLSLCEWVMRSGFRDLSFNGPKDPKRDTVETDC